MCVRESVYACMCFHKGGDEWLGGPCLSQVQGDELCV